MRWKKSLMRGVPLNWSCRFGVADDDAVALTPELERLTELSERVGVPVHLAVIPADLQDSLVDFVRENRALIPVVHGFSHQNHAAEAVKKCEFPTNRVEAEVAKELRNGFQILSEGFGDRLMPLFVPPWNRFAGAFMSLLQDTGYKGFSTFTPRKERIAFGEIEQINTHVDPIEWRGTRSLANPESIIAHTVKTLKDRRLGHADNAEPLGFLTHHLVHDPAIWGFSERFLRAFAKGPTRLWTAAE